jgi:hypothetical protein
MKKLFLCVLFAVMIMAVGSPSYAFRNNCDAIMSDIGREARNLRDVEQFMDEVRNGTPEYNRLNRERRALSGKKHQLTIEFQKCIEWRKKQQ